MRMLIGRMRLVELTPPVLARALQPFPVPVHTLDALHLATIDFIRGQGETVELASYDNRLLTATRALGIALSQLWRRDLPSAANRRQSGPRRGPGGTPSPSSG